MKTLLRVVLSVIGVVVLVGLIAWADGATLPVDHTVSVTRTVNAAPAAVFGRIVDVASAPAWRPQVKSVEVLPRDNSRDAWVEDLGHGVKMQFLALTTAAPNGTGHGVREVKLVGDASYGGTWTYDVSPGPAPNTTTLTITEKGYINSPIYRFMMAHVFGPAKNIDDYMDAMQSANK